MDYAGAAAPTGWLLCQGQLVSRTLFSALFAAIGVVYGTGDGSTTFALPDLGGRVTAGKEAAGTRLTVALSGIDSTKVGAAGGDQNFQSHNHQVPVGGLSANGVNVRAMSGDGTNFGYFGDQASGGGNSQNVQPTMIMNKIIKT